MNNCQVKDLEDVFGENMFGSRGEQGVIQDTMNAIQEGLDLTHLKTNLFLNEFYSLYNKFAPQSMGDETLKNPGVHLTPALAAASLLLEPAPQGLW